MGFAVRTFGWSMILMALFAMGWEVWILLNDETFRLSSWGELWYTVHPASLNMYQAVVERYISPVLWDEVLAPLLLYKAVFVFSIPGLFMAALPGIIEILNKIVSSDVSP